jgi:PAT family beta-lactamase induction signal transducer AmpG
MLYMMQQISPGKYHMTHYAFCTALMNLVLIPTQMASGPLADWLGYRAFFLFVMVASVPSLIAAWFAPFPDPEPRDAERAPEENLAA